MTPTERLAELLGKFGDVSTIETEGGDTLIEFFKDLPCGEIMGMHFTIKWGSEVKYQAQMADRAIVHHIIHCKKCLHRLPSSMIAPLEGKLHPRERKFIEWE